MAELTLERPKRDVRLEVKYSLHFSYESIKACRSEEELSKNFNSAGISPARAAEYAEKAFAIVHGRDFGGKRSEEEKKKSVEALVSEMKREQGDARVGRLGGAMALEAEKFSENANYQLLMLKYFSIDERKEIGEAMGKSPEEGLNKIREFIDKHKLSYEIERKITSAHRKVEDRKEAEQVRSEPTSQPKNMESPSAPLQDQAREEAIQYLAEVGMQRAKEILNSLDEKKPEREERREGKGESKEDAPKSVIETLNGMLSGGNSADEIMEMARAQQRKIEKGSRRK